MFLLSFYTISLPVFSNHKLKSSSPSTKNTPVTTSSITTSLAKITTATTTTTVSTQTTKISSTKPTTPTTGNILLNIFHNDLHYLVTYIICSWRKYKTSSLSNLFHWTIASCCFYSFNSVELLLHDAVYVSFLSSFLKRKNWVR